MMESVYIEPLEGRNTLEMDRTYIVKCSDCGKNAREPMGLGEV